MIKNKMSVDEKLGDILDNFKIIQSLLIKERKLNTDIISLIKHTDFDNHTEVNQFKKRINDILVE